MRIRSSASPLLLALAIGLGAGSGPPALAEDGKIIPLPDDVKEHLSIFGEGVLGEPRPAPEIRDFSSWLNPGPSEWHYQIVSGTDQKVRIESLERSKAVEGDDVWMRVIGDEFVEYLDLRRGAMHKIREDDQDVGYGTFIDPGVELPAPFKPGDSIRSNSKMRAYKVGDVDDIRYHGEIHSDITYVGAYQVTVPAGSWPAVLIRTDIELKIGPANVKDTTYEFYAKGVGKIAETEGLNVSALLVYHENQTTAKVLVNHVEAAKP